MPKMSTGHVLTHLGIAKGWGIHSCTLDRSCRNIGAGNRVYFTTPWCRLGIALVPGDRFLKSYDRGKTFIPSWFSYRKR